MNTLPVGLWGVPITIARVRGENAPANSSGSNDQSGARNVTYRSDAPARMASGP